MAEQSSCPVCGRTDISTRPARDSDPGVRVRSDVGRPVLRVHQRPMGGWCEGSRQPVARGAISLDRARDIGRAVESFRLGGVAIATVYAGPRDRDRIELGYQHPWSA